MNILNTQRIKNKGYMLVLVLVFASVFSILIFGLLGTVLTQNKTQTMKENQEKAFHIAEAGLGYYKWFLAHFPTDLQDGTGVPGPFVHEYSDPEGEVMGKFSLEITGNMQCGVPVSVNIKSTGWTKDKPKLTRVIEGTYSRLSVASYAYIINDNVWAGSDRVIQGPYHSNGGIRMDGTNESVVTSAKTDWECSSRFGCYPSKTQPGIFGAGANSSLWNFPVASVDFIGITLDLVSMKNKAQNSGGLYFGQAGGDSNKRGYHAIFKGDGTLDVYRVTDTYWTKGFSSSNGWQRDYHEIKNKVFLGNYAIPNDCSLIFFEDKLWVEGVVKGMVTIVSADIIDTNRDTDVILPGNITYTTNDGSDGLTVIAEQSVLIPVNSPEIMELNGILIAQSGHFGRNHYTEKWPSYAGDDAKKDSLSIRGTIVSEGRVGTKWSSGGVFVSGYNMRINSYDRNLADNPPPFTPKITTEHRFSDWGEGD